MGSTFFSLHYHAVFSTKERRTIIKTEWRPRLHSYLGGIVRGMDGVAEIVGGVEDHVHLLMSLRPIHCLAYLMRDLKKDSTNWVKENLDRSFCWQEGYAAFTVPLLLKQYDNTSRTRRDITPNFRSLMS